MRCPALLFFGAHLKVGSADVGSNHVYFQPFFPIRFCARSL